MSGGLEVKNGFCIITSMASIKARHYATGTGYEVILQDGEISALSYLFAGGREFPFVAPGLVDLQVNGYGGMEFNDPALTSEKVRKIALAMDQDGVVEFCPTFTTADHALLRHSIRTVADTIESDADVARRCQHLHLEGPFISAEDGPRGAHPQTHVRPPCWDEFQQLQEAARGRIKILTMSPEYDGSPQFIGKIVDSGVVVAIGHTSASSDQIAAAVDAGASMSTHLGNGAHGTIRRHPNYLWDQIAEDRLTCSLIADGHHLPAAVVKTVVRAKSVERCVLVSDITGMGGMPPGIYESTAGLGKVEVLDDGRLVVPGQRQLLAGAALPIGVGIVKAMEYAELPLESAVNMASLGPARIVGYRLPKLEVGTRADLVFFDIIDGQFEVVATVNAGEIVYLKDS
ncbi:MAG: N-acetylglucosamine-6-phosphate deacetylase [Planctomycetaceae bacterium]|nr:N-acetylglucosamine-6-phosphate deacetylase [Planctomycetaceae bacterium]